MPAPASTKRIRGVQIHRPFVFGSEAIPFDPNNRPRDAPPDHTHRWRVFVRGIPTGGNSSQQQTTDISHWLKKVQFKLHDTYANSVRMVESPPFEVEETGWGEFEIAIKFYFVPESNEKPQTLWHALKLHPYTGDIEKQKLERTMVKSICYEEIVFTEPMETFYDVLTGGGDQQKGKGAKPKSVSNRTAEIPQRSDGVNVWSHEEEGKELDRLAEAVKKVEKLITQEKAMLVAEEKKLASLERSEGRLKKK